MILLEYPTFNSMIHLEYPTFNSIDTFRISYFYNMIPFEYKTMSKPYFSMNDCNFLKQFLFVL
jgi:hypothetical protein